VTRSRLPSLSPADGVVTLRSLPRRYREAFAGAKRRARAEVVGADGVSPLDLLDDTVGSLSVLERALDQIDTSDEPVLHPGVVDPAERDFAGAGSVDAGLDQLDAVANSFADRVAAVAADAWTRTGTIAGRGASNGGPQTVTALEVLQEAAATATDNLRAADRLLAPPPPA
jgi:hypothetical protein